MLPTLRASLGLRLPGCLAVLGVTYLLSRLALVWRFPYHVDEAVFAGYTLTGYTGSSDDKFVALTAGQQPLLEWLGMGGMSLGLEPLTALRLVSLVAGAVTLAVLVWLGRWLGGWPVGVAVGALWVVAPFALVYTSLGLYDPLAAMFVVCAFALQVALAERPRIELGVVLGLVLGAALLTKQTANVALYLMPLGALAFDWRGQDVRRRLALWISSLLAAAAVAWCVYQVMRLSDFYDDLGAGRDVLSRHGWGEALDRPLFWLGQNAPDYLWALFAYLTPPVAVVLLVGVVRGLGDAPRKVVLLLAWSVLPLVGIVMLADTPYIRWLAIVVPFFLVLAGHGLVAVVRWAGRKTVRVSRMRSLTVVATVALALIYDGWILAAPSTARYPANDEIAYVRGGEAGGPWRRVAGDLRERAGGRPLVISTGGFCCGALPLLLRHDASVQFVRAESEDTGGALLAIENQVPLPARAPDMAWKEVARFPRPRGGTPVVLYASAVRLGDRVATTPDELRALIGGGDSDFDAFTRDRPVVKAWLDAWYALNPPA